jgi:hypothetical protein
MTKMAKAIYDFVKDRRHVSFVELRNQIPGFCYKPLEGQKATALCVPGYPSIVIWINVTDEAISAINELNGLKKVFINPCSHLVYLIDGCMLNFPIPKRMPKPTTKKDWWIPCVLDVEPSTTKSRRP